MGKPSRDKGARGERAVAALLSATKVSGMYKDGHDLEMPDGRTVEVKIRAKGFALLYRWLAPVDLLVVKADRKEALVVMRISDFTSDTHILDSKKS